jgi:hypothetical protein
MDQIQADSLKLRAVLIREVLSPNYSPTQASIIEKRITKLDKRRTAIIIDTVNEANRILGRMDTLDRQQFLWDLMESSQQMHGEY